MTTNTDECRANDESAGQMLQRLGMDGVLWAREFRTTAIRLGYADMDEGWLTGWFCNAVMAGFDEATRRLQAAAGRDDALMAKALRRVEIFLEDTNQAPELRKEINSALAAVPATQVKEESPPRKDGAERHSGEPSDSSANYPVSLGDVPNTESSAATRDAGEGDDYKVKYEKLKEFVRGKWKGDCSECASLANNVLNQETALRAQGEGGAK